MGGRGLEITVADSSSRVHLLAVFDPTGGSQKIAGVLGSCGITSGYGDDKQKSTTTGFIDTVKNITNADGIAIPAHIDGAKGLLENIASLTPESELPDVISAIKLKTFDIANGQSSGNHGAFDNRLKKILETQPAVFDQLDAWWPEDILRVKYSKDPSSGKFEDLEKGSAGQKAAAIMAFLLSHGNEPLVIDQPEDDLDNALIYDLIVTQIHENKNRRQLIIVTHNPNIVVNGDAELAHVLKFKNGQVQIDQQGGLEEANIRDAICAPY